MRPNGSSTARSGLRSGGPSKTSETICGPAYMDFCEQAALAFVPGCHLSHQSVGVRRRAIAVVGEDPVHRGQQLKTIGRREASDKPQHSIDSICRLVWTNLDPLVPLFFSARHERDRAEFHHFLSAISVAAQIVALQCLELVIKVLGVRSVRCNLVPDADLGRNVARGLQLAGRQSGRDTRDSECMPPQCVFGQRGDNR